MINKEGNRELAYLVKVDSITPIEGADRVELAHIKGWTCMVRKDQFKAGDYAVYFETDSKVPAKEPFMFLESKHFKIKCQRYFKGTVISNGLLMSIDDFIIDGKSPNWVISIKDRISRGIDVEHEGLTQELGITYADAEDNSRKSNVDKYSSMVSRKPAIFKHKWAKWLMKREWGRKLMFAFFGRKKDNKRGWPVGKFPGVSKTDQERCENLYGTELNDPRHWTVTTKVDGTSATYILHKLNKRKYEYYVLSRNIRQMDRDQKNFHSDEENIYWDVSDIYKIYDFLKEYIDLNDLEWACLQGEICGRSVKGVKIQGDPHQLKDLRFFGFHFTDSKHGRLHPLQGRGLCEMYGIDWVPIVNKDFVLPATMEELKEQAVGPCDIIGSHGLREGFVYYWNDDPRISFKNVSNQYLLNKK